MESAASEHPGIARQLVPALIKKRVKQGTVDRVLGQHRAHDHLLRGHDGLAVVPGHVAFLVPHHPYVGVGDIRPRLGAGPVSARLIAWAVPAPLPGRRGFLPGLLPGPLRLAARLVPGRQPVPGPGQPLPPLSPAGQRPRRRRLRVITFRGVAGGGSSLEQAAPVATWRARIFQPVA